MWQTHSVVRVTTQLQFKDQWIQVVVEVADITSDVLFELDLSASIGAGLQDLVDLVGGALDVPHAPVDLTGNLELQDLKFRFDPHAAQVTLIALDIGTDPSTRWHLWDRPAASSQDPGVYLDTIKISFRLTPGSAGYVVDGAISGQVEGWLALQASFASDGEFTFYGDLIAPKTIKDLYQFFTARALDDLPDLEVDTFEFTLDRSAAQIGYSGELMLNGQWPILSEPPIALDGVAFKIDQAPGDVATNTTNTTFTARAVLGISDYTVGVEADYDTAKGWTFAGTVDATAENATLQALIDKIDAEFKPDAKTALALPAFLTGWSLQNLAAQFTTQEKNFDFTASVANSAAPWLALDFGVHLTNSAATTTRTLDGLAQIQAPAFDAKFALNLSAQTTATTPASTTTTLTGDYSSDKPPTLDQLLVWLAQTLNVGVSLPAELNIDAAATGFGVQVQQKDQEPQSVEVGGEFTVQADGSDFDVSFAFSNDTSFAAGGARALDSTGQPVCVFGAALGGLLDLSKLPLVGRIPGVDKLRIDKLGFFYTNAVFAQGTTQLFFNVPGVLSPGKLAGDPTAAYLTQPGFSLLAVFGDQPNATGTGVVSPGTMPLPVTTGQPPAGGAGFATQAAAPADPIHWLDLHKTLGPVSLQKVGVAYEKPDDSAHQLGKVSVYLDGAFTIAGLALALDNLGVSVDVPNPAGGISFNPVKDVDFHLGGLFVGYQAPDLQISGGFITLPGSGISFIGEFSVQAGQFGLQAYGGFSNQEADPSLFLFVHVEAPIGGPPFLFINGLAGGFGVNRSFTLPTFAQLTSYPFLPALPASSVIPGPSALGGDAESQLATMMKALTNLSQYVPVKAGEYWLAAGLDVNSFEMIDVSAVLSVAFGVEFQLGVVGSATVTVPVNEPLPIAYIQVDFELAFSPSNGLLAAFGNLTPASFIYGGMVHLSGGFAFATWFSGPDAGNYVVTIGGYNALYQKPADYPDVPRLQARFGINALNVTGDAYFALVPHALMAGLSIHATWSLAPIDAWFDAAVDFLLNWKPFHYEADAYVHVGISATIHVLFVKKRVTLHASVDLDIWGPPFGGQAVIDLHLVSFKIAFGQSQVHEQVDWTGFRQFLPSVDADAAAAAPAAGARMAVSAALAAADTGNKPLVNITVAAGLLKGFKPGESADNLDWLLDPNGFALATQSAAPCTGAVFNSAPDLKTLPASQYIDPDALDSGIQNALGQHESAPFFAYDPGGGPAWNALTFGIPPMNLQNIQSVHTVTIQALDQPVNAGGQDNDFIVVLQTANVSQALWGMAGVSSESLDGGNEVIAGALTGLTVLPMLWIPARTSDISYYDLVFDTNDLFLEQATLPSINTTPFANPDQVYGSMNDGTLFSSTAPARAAVVSVLQANGFATVALVNDGDLNTGQDTGNPALAYFSDSGETDFAA